jgi:hypothetical protein
MISNAVYFELNDWWPDEYYPDEEPFKAWMETIPSILTNDEWARKNKLCIKYELIDQSLDYLISASEDWIKENCPNLLTKYCQFLRQPYKGEVCSNYGTNFLEYTSKNYGSYLV